MGRKSSVRRAEKSAEMGPVGSRGLSNDLGKQFDPVENRRNSYGLTGFLVQAHHRCLAERAAFQA
jgi:hypothetical protein